MKLIASITLIALFVGRSVEERRYTPGVAFLMMLAILGCVWFFGYRPAPTP